MESKNYQHIKFEAHLDGIGVLTINRENKLNALNGEVLGELREFLRELARDKEFKTKGLIVTGSGEKAFIAGADIAQMQNMDDRAAFEFGELGQEVTLMLEALRIPVLAAVSGFALGGGCELALACDFIYATKKSVFGQPEVKLGLIPGFGGTQRLSRVVGRNLAREIIFTGENLTADEAWRIGLVNKLFETKLELLEEARKTLLKIAQNSPIGVWHSKRAINFGVDLTVKEGLSFELEEFSLCFNSRDRDEGIGAFLEKRKPIFPGK